MRARQGFELMQNTTTVCDPYNLAPAVASVSADDRRMMISEAAYFMAKRRNFAPGHELEDWLLAEKQVDAALTSTWRGDG